MNMDTLDDIPWRKEKEAFEAIAAIGSYESLSEEDRFRYDEAQRNYWDSVAIYEGAIELGEKAGIKKGREEGRNTLNAVYAQLLALGRSDDLARSVRDPEYLKKIMAEFGISDDESQAD